MGWLKLEGRRATNKKLRRAGFAARGLDETAMCQIAEDLTDGFISEDTVETLAILHKEKKWRRLVDILVDVNRWEKVDGGWLIHDYLEYNPTKEEWERLVERRSTPCRRGGQASVQARASADGQASGSANSEAGAQAVSSSSRSVSSRDLGKRRSSTHARPQQAGTDDDRNSIEEALRMLAERDLEAREADVGRVRNRARWLETAIEDRRSRHADSLTGFEGLSAVEIVELLEPAGGGSNEDQLAAAAAETRRRAQLPYCENCDSTGYKDGDPAKGKCVPPEGCGRLLPASKTRSKAGR